MLLATVAIVFVVLILLSMPIVFALGVAGIESRISTTKTMATVASSMNGPPQCWGSPCGGGEIIIAKP